MTAEMTARRLMIGCAVVTVLLCSCIADNAASQDNELTVNSKLPQFSTLVLVCDTADWRFNDSDYLFDSHADNGSVRVIVFFHTSCPDCQRDLPVIQSVYNIIKGNRDVSLVCISREQDASDIQDYWHQNNLTLPYSAQSDRSIYNLFASSGIPRIYVTDRDGVVRRIYTDKDAPQADELAELIENPFL